MSIHGVIDAGQPLRDVHVRIGTSAALTVSLSDVDCIAIEAGHPARCAWIT